MKYLFLLLFSSSLWAVDIQTYRFTNSLTYQGLESAWNDNPINREKYDYLLTAAYSYFYRPLVWENDPRTHLYDNIVSHSRVVHLGLGIPLGNGLLSFSTAYVQQDHLKDLTDTLVGSPGAFQDLNIRYKWSAWQNKNKTWGLAIMPQVTLPTGRAEYYLSDRSALGGGLDLALEKRFSWIHITANIGYHYSGEAVQLNMDRRNLYLTGLGAYIPFGKNKTWATTIEWRRNWSAVSDFNPTEIHLSLQKQITSSITAFASVGSGDPTNFNNNINGNSYRFLAGLKIHPTKNKAPEVLPSAPSVFPIKPCECPKLPINRFIVHFNYDEANVRKTEEQTLAQVWEASKYNNNQILVSSHTDLRGTSPYNNNLSNKRTQAVVNYLIKLGISNARIIRHAQGKEMPLIKEAQNDFDHEQNRRSEITIISESPANEGCVK